MRKRLWLFLVLLSAFALAKEGDLAKGFLNPPPWAKPWVYWFWLNGYITKEGITADLEAMKRAGIGGVLIMEVDQGTPPGKVSFASPEWRDLFQHVLREADRLGLKVNMNNDAGWTGSGGPWVTPELAMQRIVWSEVTVEGPSHISLTLPQPPTVANLYHDIAVLAIPYLDSPFLIGNIEAKAFFVAPWQPFLLPATYPSLGGNQVIPKEKVLDLTPRLSQGGRLEWDVPAGKWTIIRFGYTPTGAQNAPSPASGRGFECDKLSKEAVEHHFNSFIDQLIKNAGPLAGRTFVATHIDSWEVGSQNWTPKMREEFKKRRGYDLLPFLPVVTGRVVESLEVSERFLWDFRQTISDLLVENYARHMRDLANRWGLKLTMEGYATVPADEFAYGGSADEPMGEFWSWGKYGGAQTCSQMVSVGHTYGKRIIGAEAFTADNNERWLGYPGNIKELADWAFTEGINRFVVHRYALQPWLDVKPGMSMGPWGLHYERTQTWWEWSKPWHDYLSRCQYLLQQGLFVADILFLAPEGAPQCVGGQRLFEFANGRPLERPGYNFDIASSEVILKRASVKNGRIVLPDGMTYRLLVLPSVQTMTPQLLRKVGELVRAGATVVGAPPLKSPSLGGYPKCDEEVRRLVKEIWGDIKPPSKLTERYYGKGRIIWGGAFKWGAELEAVALLSGAKWIWYPEDNPLQALPSGIKRYFRKTLLISKDSPLTSALCLVTADNEFTLWVNGKFAGRGDRWERIYRMEITRLLKPGENIVTVLAKNGGDIPNPAGLIGAICLRYGDGQTEYIPTDASWESSLEGERWVSAMELGHYGIGPWGQAGGQAYYDLKEVCTLVERLGVPPDFSYQPKGAPGTLRYIHRNIKGTDVYFVANQEGIAKRVLCAFRVRGKHPQIWNPENGERKEPAIWYEKGGQTFVSLNLEPYGSLFVVFPPKRESLPKEMVWERTGRALEIEGKWELRFPPNWGAPDRVFFDRLISWSEHPDPGIRYFSGTATYRKIFQIPPGFWKKGERVSLDLGEVEVMAEVIVNGENLGILWKAPFKVDVTRCIKEGLNELEVRVTNLWVNRMLGDEELPEDSERNPDGTLRRWPDWLLEGRVSPTGRFTFTTWRLWRKGEPLLRSGLLGPVRLEVLKIASPK